MPTQTYRLDIQVDANRAESTLASIEKRMGVIEKATGSAGQGVDRFNGNVNDAARSLDKFVSGSKPVQQNLAKLKNNIDETTSASKRLDNSLKGLSPTLGSIATQMAGVFTVSTAISKMDAFAGMQNRLKLVTKSAEDLNKSMQETFKIVQSTGSDWDSAVLVFQKFSENADQLNLDLAKTAKLTDTVSKAVAISGSSAQSAAAALTQFGQGLGSGVLRGDEFNSVNENANGIIKALAYGLNVTSGELRTMANEGKLTGEVLVEALDKAKPYIDEMFSKTDFTIGQSIQMLSNSMTKFVGEAGQASGAASALSSAIQILANNFNAVADTTMVAGITYATYAIAQKTQSVYASITALIAERTANAQKAQSELAVAKSEVATTQAKLAKVQASYKSVAALRGEAMAQAQLTAATNAATQAQINLGKAKKAVVATAGGMRGVMAGLAGVMGGPMGLALMVGGVAASYMLLKDNTQKADAVLETNKKTVAELAEEYRKLNENQKQLARDQITKEIREKTQAYKDQINELTILTARIANNSKATAEQKAEIFASMQALRDKSISAEELAIKVRGMGVASEDFAMKLTEQAHKTQKAKDDLDHAESIGRAYENTAYDASNASSSLAGQMDNVAGAASNAADEVAGLTKKAQEYLSTISQTAFADAMTLEMMKKGFSEGASRDFARVHLANNGVITSDIAREILDADKAREELRKYRESQKPKSSRGSGGSRSRSNGRSGGSGNSKKSKSISSDDTQIMVYKAWISAGLSEKQALAATAEVGRENDYAIKYLFGGHTDKSNKKASLGMLSWQGSRREELIKYLTQAGVYKNGRIEQSQEALNAQARFAVKEMVENPAYRKTRDLFLSNPNVDYKTSYEVLGDDFVRWDRSGRAVLGASGAQKHAQKRDKYYEQISAKVGGDIIVQDFQELVEKQADLAKKQAEARERIEYELLNAQAKAKADHEKKVKELMEAGFEPEVAAAYEEILVNRFKLNAAYQDKQLAYDLYSFRLSARERLDAERDLALEKIKIDADLTDEQKEYYKQATLDKYDFDVKKFKNAQAKKVKDLEKLIGGIGRGGHANAMTDMLNQHNMSSLNYGKWQINRQMVTREKEQLEIYQNVVDSIKAIDEVGEYVITNAHERHRLLQEAEKAHESEMKAIRERAADEMRQHEEDNLNMTLQRYGATFGALAGLIRGYQGEQSSTYRALFAASKAFAIAEASQNVWLAASDAYAKEPGTVWNKLKASAIAAAKSSSFIPLIQAVTPRGFKSGGYTGNIGVNSIAGVVHGQEYVMNAKATKRIGVNNLERLSNGENIGGVKVIINNYSNETATAEQMPNGDVLVTVGKMSRHIAQDEIQKYHRSQLRQGGAYYGR
ncbi:tape measure protein [Moraxella sp. Tifton1]|uniref:tape measure protein n=1 Tax=Moraxella oculi TaxID=2940516 RepID=UPI0020128FEB|nr:tape measure protein [Moraxella sp. Tifton1]MCL1623812.1 tape measure protein [Moraxella sp. Tifton1]